MPCHSERSEESLFFFGARFLTTFGMTKGAFGMTNTVICAHLRPFAKFAKFAFGLLSFRAKRRISFRYFWLDPKVTKKSRLRALRTPSRRLQVGKSGNSLPLFPPFEGGAGGMSLCVRIPCIRHNIIQLLMVNC